MSRTRDDARSTLAALPGGLTALAAEAGVSQPLLSLIKSGRRSLTPGVAAQLAAVLDLWSKRCADAASALRETVD